MNNSSAISLLSCFKTMSIDKSSFRRVMDGNFSRRWSKKSGYSSLKHWRNLASPPVWSKEGVNVSNSWRLSLSFNNSQTSCAILSFSVFDWFNFWSNKINLSTPWTLPARSLYKLQLLHYFEMYSAAVPMHRSARWRSHFQASVATSKL